MDETGVSADIGAPIEPGALPTGTITFLYTDVQGSTGLWQEHPAAMPHVMARHDVVLRQVVGLHGGLVFRTMGDAICAAFPVASEALTASLEAQSALTIEPWDDGIDLRVRMALHSGTADVRDGDYVGHTLNRIARLLAAGHGGQILLSGATYELVRDQLPPDIELRDLGEHRLKDLVRPEHIYWVVAPGLQDGFPPLRTIDTHPTNLPADSTSFVGRQREVLSVIRLLRQEDVRLLTLTGPGGTGKTRLSVHVGAILLGDFPDGVFFVPLGAIADAALVAPTIATTLGVHDAAGQSLDITLRQYLEQKQMLLVLDNFEHLTAASPLVAELLAASPRLKILVTSRSVLHLSAEHDFATPPLAVPDPQHLPSLEALSQYDAVALFIQRAQAAKPDFTVTSENAPAVAEICHRLDGLPLAIELAAARVRLFPPQALLRRLESRLQMLTGGARDRPQRQQTLRATLNWSYSLLDGEEQTLFRRLSIFAGPWSFEAAEEVCDSEGDLDLIGGVESLVEKSLLRHEEQDGEPQFAMLQTIREYALEKLRESGEWLSIQRRHAAYFLRVAEEGLDGLLGPEQQRWMRMLDATTEDTRAALACTLEVGDVETALRLSGSLSLIFWYWRGYWNEGRRWLERALAFPGATELPRESGRALLGLGMLSWLMSDYTTARDKTSKGVELVDPDDPWRAYGYEVLGWVIASEGNLEEARRSMEEAVRLGSQSGIPWHTGNALHSLGAIIALQGDLVSGAAYVEKAYSWVRGTDELWGTSYVLNTLGDLARLRGDYERAGEYYTQSLENFTSVGNRNGAASTSHNLGYVALHDGNVGEACQRFGEALTLFRELGDRRGMAESVIGFGAVAVVAGQFERGARLFGAGERTLMDLGTQLSQSNTPDYEHYLALVRTGVGGTAFESARDEGRSMGQEQAIAYALEAGSPL